MYYYALHVTNMVAMTTMYMVNFVNKWQEGEENAHSPSYFYNIDHRQTNLVCMCTSITRLLKTAILSNIQLIWFP